MNVLEKILEEIEKEQNSYEADHAWNYSKGMEYAKEIIRSHMGEAKDTNVPSNDYWIPVEERLPEESGHYLVQLSRKIPYENFADRVVMLYDGEEKAFLDYESLIIAWQPLPESYKPKKATAAGMEHIMSRFTKVE